MLHKIILFVIKIWEAFAILLEQMFGAIFRTKLKIVSLKMKLLAINHLVLSFILEIIAHKAAAVILLSNLEFH